jgi:hypothetical protein
VTPYSVTQSGTTVQISSSAAGFTQNSAYQYYLNSADLSLRTDSYIVTFGDGASIRLTDFSEIPFGTGGSSSKESVVGIPATAQGGFDNSVNIIGGYGYASTFDIYDNISGSLLIDDYEPQTPFGGYFEPYAEFGYTNSSSSLTVSAPRTSGFRAGASIGADGLGSFTPSSYVGGNSGTPGSQYVSGGGASPWVFSLTSPTPTPVPICFAEGTLILIEKNQYKAIEKIQTGDYIPTSRGVKRIKWVARRHYPYSVLELFPQVLPVRFKQNSISNSVPFSDLLVSQRHGIFVEGKEVGASMLENGISITRCAQDEFPDGITYYHLEFDEQEVIDAQGFTSTSFVGVGNRSEFDNANEFERLYGNLDAPTPINYVPFKRQQYNALCKKLTFRAIYEWKDASTRDTHISTTSNKSSIPQSSTVTIFPAKSSDSAVAAFSSVLARRATVVAATPA